jgi:uncharacterized protein (TIGR02246 family)
LLAVIVLAACGGAAEETPAESTAPATPATPAEAPMDDAAALDEMTEYFVTHYNMHHADMVAELYAEDAIFLGADGSVQDGRAAIQTAMVTAMAGSPTLSIDVADRVITDGDAVSYGAWAVETTPEGAPAPMAIDGHFMTVHRKEGGEWRTAAVLTNYDEEPPAEMPRAEDTGEAPPDLTDSALAELAGYYATHFNMGHGDMVASRYAEDAVASFANLPLASGRAAIAEQLNARTAEGDPQITIHEVEAMDIGDGWTLGAGWYEISAATGNSDGAYMMLTRAGDDGNMQIHWAVSNGNPVAQ